MRLQPLFAALAAAALPLQSLAAHITVRIPQTNLVNPSTLPPSTHATLHSTGPALSAPLSRDNTFSFADVAPGSYLLSVHCRDYAFENLRVDVKADEEIKAWQTFRGNEWDNLGEKRAEGGGRLVVEVRPVAGKEFYQARSGFSPLSFLKNPMILMGVFSLVLIVGMPYLMENMDPETKAEFEEMQKSSPLASANPAAQIQNFDLASWMAGKSGEEAKQGGSGGSKKRG